MKNHQMIRWTREGELSFPWGRFETLDTLVLSEGLLEQLKNITQPLLSAREQFLKFELPWRCGVFLFGPPGSGKTAAGKAIALSLNWQHFTIPSHEIMDSHFLERALADAVKTPERVIVLEDVDVMIRKMEPQVFFELLDHAMSKSEGFFWIASSRHPEETPKTQLLRPGRFEEAIRLEIPQAELRAQILKQLLTEIEEFSEENPLSVWIENTSGLSFAHFEELRQIKLRMLVQGRDKIEISLALSGYVNDQLIAGDRWGGLSDSTQDLKQRASEVDPRMLLAALDMNDVFRRLIEKVISDAALARGGMPVSQDDLAGS
jgi:SpoVK/Ycf46/Vps4 family AAA+-type ATPase